MPGIDGTASPGRAALGAGPELLWYTDRLAEPGLVASAIVLPTGLIAVPIGASRHTGTVFVDDSETGRETVQLLARHDGFPDLRVDEPHGVVVWGAEYPLPQTDLPLGEWLCHEVSIGRLLGYSDPAIRRYLTRRGVGEALADLAVQNLFDEFATYSVDKL